MNSLNIQTLWMMAHNLQQIQIKPVALPHSHSLLAIHGILNEKALCLPPIVLQVVSESLLLSTQLMLSSPNISSFVLALANLMLDQHCLERFDTLVTSNYFLQS